VERRLPPLGSRATLYEFTNGRYGFYTELCYAVKTDMIAHDRNDNAIEKWMKFLEEFRDLPQRGFPQAACIYALSESGER